MSGWGKTALFGGVLAVVVVGAVVAALYTGVIEPPARSEATRLLVIGTAPDESGTELAAFAFVVDVASGEVVLTDTLKGVTVPGTSATNAREALPFGGGAGVAQALADQTGDAEMPWVILPASTWSGALEDMGGVDLTIPERFSSYSDGELVLLEPGSQKVSATDAVVLAGALQYFVDDAGRGELINGLAGAVSAKVAQGTTLSELVASGDARSSLEPARIPALP